jgi:hypothetical protein
VALSLTLFPVAGGAQAAPAIICDQYRGPALQVDSRSETDTLLGRTTLRFRTREVVQCSSHPGRDLALFWRSRATETTKFSDLLYASNLVWDIELVDALMGVATQATSTDSARLHALAALAGQIYPDAPMPNVITFLRIAPQGDAPSVSVHHFGRRAASWPTGSLERIASSLGGVYATAANADPRLAAKAVAGYARRQIEMEKWKGWQPRATVRQTDSTQRPRP